MNVLQMMQCSRMFKINQKWVYTPVPWIIWVRLFLHANDLGEIFLQFISFLPFQADSVQVPTMFFFTLSTGLSGQKLHPVLKGFTLPSHPSLHPPTGGRKPHPSPIRKRIAHETLEDIFGQLQHHFTRQCVSGKERLPGNPRPGLRIPWEWWCLTETACLNHKNPWDWHIYLYTFG